LPWLDLTFMNAYLNNFILKFKKFKNFFLFFCSNEFEVYDMATKFLIKFKKINISNVKNFYKDESVFDLENSQDESNSKNLKETNIFENFENFENLFSIFFILSNFHYSIVLVFSFMNKNYLFQLDPLNYHTNFNLQKIDIFIQEDTNSCGYLAFTYLRQIEFFFEQNGIVSTEEELKNFFNFMNLLGFFFFFFFHFF
jgi:hypothetical protein